MQRSIVFLIGVTVLGARSGELEAQLASGLRVDATRYVQLDGDGSGAPLARISSVAFGDRDEVLVADGPNFRVLRFSRDGEFLGSHGRQGSGPGEYQVIEWIGLCGSRTVVFDLMQRRFTVLDRNLRFESAFQSSGSPNALACGADGRVVYLDPDFSPPASAAGAWRPRATVVVLDSARAGIRRLTSVPYADLISVAGSPMFAPGGRQPTLAVLPTGDIAVATGDESPIMLLGASGAGASSVPHGLRSQRISESQRRAYAEEFVSRNTDPLVRQRIADQILRNRDEVSGPAYRRVLADAEGVLWVQVSLPGSTALRVLALDQRGRRLAEVTFPFSGDLAAVDVATLAVIAESSDGAPVLRLVPVRR